MSVPMIERLSESDTTTRALELFDPSLTTPLDFALFGEIAEHLPCTPLEARDIFVDLLLAGHLDVSGSVAKEPLVQRSRSSLRTSVVVECPAVVPSTSRHRRVHLLGERDGWDCYLCGEPLVDTCGHDGTLRRSLHRWLPTIEHVVARALGGSNDPENLRLACWTCNARKGAQ